MAPVDYQRRPTSSTFVGCRLQHEPFDQLVAAAIVGKPEDEQAVVELVDRGLVVRQIADLADRHHRVASIAIGL